MSLESPLNGQSGSAYLVRVGLTNHRFTLFSSYSAPYLVILKDRGKTLRFYRARQLYFQQDVFREFLKTESWQLTPPWSSAYSPGGPK